MSYNYKEKIIEDNIGISKDFNVFELQNALGIKDVLKSNQIIKYFSENPKNHPFVLTLSSLFTFFQKVMIYQNLNTLLILYRLVFLSFKLKET